MDTFFYIIGLFISVGVAAVVLLIILYLLWRVIAGTWLTLLQLIHAKRRGMTRKDFYNPIYKAWLCNFFEPDSSFIEETMTLFRKIRFPIPYDPAEKGPRTYTIKAKEYGGYE